MRETDRDLNRKPGPCRTEERCPYCGSYSYKVDEFGGRQIMSRQVIAYECEDCGWYHERYRSNGTFCETVDNMDAVDCCDFFSQGFNLNKAVEYYTFR